MQGPCVVTADADGEMPALADNLVWQESPPGQLLDLHPGAHASKSLRRDCNHLRSTRLSAFLSYFAVAHVCACCHARFTMPVQRQH